MLQVWCGEARTDFCLVGLATLSGGGGGRAGGASIETTTRGGLKDRRAAAVDGFGRVITANTPKG